MLCDICFICGDKKTAFVLIINASLIQFEQPICSLFVRLKPGTLYCVHILNRFSTVLVWCIHQCVGVCDSDAFSFTLYQNTTEIDSECECNMNAVEDTHLSSGRFRFQQNRNSVSCQFANPSESEKFTHNQVKCLKIRNFS